MSRQQFTYHILEKTIGSFGGNLSLMGKGNLQNIQGNCAGDLSMQVWHLREKYQKGTQRTETKGLLVAPHTRSIKKNDCNSHFCGCVVTSEGMRDV